MQSGAGVVQGRTLPPGDQPQPLFNHFIETTRFDGSFSTSNVAYRRDALLDAGGFDPECDYWEDVDLGWRVTELGWEARFATEALVYHQVLALSAGAWLRHAARVGNYPAKVARYPEFRRHLSMRLWVDPSLALFHAAILGLALGSRKPPFLLLTLPYLASLVARKRFVGRRPPLRAAAYVARDAVSTAALIAGSVRHRTVVL
jgi:GT2 family glycosyltransferase